MTFAEFGTSIQQKYPQYSGVDPEALGRQMVQKYPVYANQITQQQPQQQADTAQAAQNPQIKSILEGNLQGGNLVKGNDILANIINSAASPFVKTGQEIGGAAFEGGRAIDQAAGSPLAKILGLKNDYIDKQGNAVENPVLSQQNLQQASQHPLDYILNQGKQSAAVASYGVPFGKAADGAGLIKGLLQKAVLPGAAVGAAQELPQATSLDDILKAGITGGVTGGALQATGSTVGALKNVLGNGLQKGAESLSNKVDPGIFNKVVKASPSYAPDVQNLTNTAKKFGLMDGNSQQGLEKLPSVMEDLGSQIQSKLAQVKKPVDLTDAKNNIMKTFESSSNVFPNSEDFQNAKDYISQRLGFGSGTDAQLVPKVSASDLYGLKQQVGNDLSQTFKKLANGNTNLMPKEEANLALWGGLKDVIDQVAPGVSQINNDQHNLFDVARGLVADAQKGGKGPNMVSDIFATLAGHMLGGVPGAMAAGIGEHVMNTPKGRNALSNILQAGSNIAQKNVPNATGMLTKVGAGSALPFLGGYSDQNGNNQTSNNLQNNHPNGNISQTGGNSNTPSVNDYIDYVQGRQPGSTKDRQTVAQEMANNPALADKIGLQYETQLGTPEQQAEAQARYTSDRVVTDLEKQYNQGNLAQGRIGGKMAEILSATGFNPNLNVYDKAREAAASQIAQALSDTGSKSTAKLTRAVSLLPTADSTPEEAKKSFAEIRDILGLLPRK